MRNLVVSGSTVLSILALLACGDDTGGGGGAGGSGTTGATTTTAASTSDAASTSASTSVASTSAASTSGGDGGTGGLGTGGEDVGSGGFGGASTLLDCADTDLEEEDLGELDCRPIVQADARGRLEQRAIDRAAHGAHLDLERILEDLGVEPAFTASHL